MISISSCLCALLLASYTVAAPAAAPSAPVSSAIAISSALSSAVSSAAHSSSHSSSSSAPTATSTAAGPEATRATIDLDPNEPLWNINSTGTPEAIRGSLGASVLGPTDEYTVKQNPDLLAPPSTDHGSVKNAKWAFSLSHNRLENGGWARQENIGVMPIATEMASVNMRLEPGAVRELHWHKTAEWAYILKGHTQISAVDYDGKNYVATMGPGDLWYFPAGIPHSLQATADDPAGAEFVLVFDTGDFSEDSTFLLTDWLAHVPAEVIAKNFQTPIDAFKNVPSEELYIFPTTPPSDNAAAPKSPQGTVPSPFSFEFSKVKATQHSGGTSKIVDTSSFPISKTITAAEITIEPGAMRELHWHPTDDEWSFFIEGNARMTIFAAQSNARTFDYQPGDIGYVPATMGHYVENIGNTTVRFLEIFKTDKFQDISLNQWLALTPPDLVKAHLGLSDDTIAHLSKVKNVVVGPAN
ncbi:oxalate decarboxylase [Crucibulum laeve]|uniref:Oxalate decarboxylase n=1 Tax=Crucibulum laeve TaxID=68775 RepID=A0A5C3LN54_9AGAR|nr:oxalate decarboxylase [Crucibulum laeve]